MQYGVAVLALPPSSKQFTWSFVSALQANGWRFYAGRTAAITSALTCCIIVLSRKAVAMGGDMPDCRWRVPKIEPSACGDFSGRRGPKCFMVRSANRSWWPRKSISYTVIEVR